VLEAGAGTGKTTLLVDRIESLVLSGHARLDEIAAVTFTENAATSMKLRLRERLERAQLRAGVAAEQAQRAARALELLERAQVSTIHALCAAILGERPLECGVIPGFRMADEALADILFGVAWEEWLAERLIGGDLVLAEALDQEIPPGTGEEERSRCSSLRPLSSRSGPLPDVRMPDWRATGRHASSERGASSATPGTRQRRSPPGPKGTAPVASRWPPAAACQRSRQPGPPTLGRPTWEARDWPMTGRPWAWRPRWERAARAAGAGPGRATRSKRQAGLLDFVDLLVRRATRCATTRACASGTAGAFATW
jgi:hypothetical protein